ncbi:unnamed protein product [Withania somnifera]
MVAKKNILFFVVIVVVIISPWCYGEDAVCDYVASCFAYCEVYVDGVAKDPTRECCDMLFALNRQVKYVEHGVLRYCYCIQNFSNSHHHPPYLQSRIHKMTRICGVNLSFPISQHMDCSKKINKLNIFSPFKINRC